MKQHPSVQVPETVPEFQSKDSFEFRGWLRTRLFITGLIFSAFILLPALYDVAQAHDVIESCASGSINWTQGLITATGAGPALQNSIETSPPDIRSAKQAAVANLLETIREVRIDSNSLVRQYETENAVIAANLENMARGSTLINRKYLSDGTVEVSVQLRMTGGFSQLLLPQDIRQIESVTLVGQAPASETDRSSTAPEQTIPGRPGIESDLFTGMIVDARGLNARPSMSPKIVDETGREVYGAAYASREFAVQYGMSGYSTDIDHATANSRVAEKPIIVKGLKTAGEGRSDIIISNSDASKIRSASGNLSFLKKCRVIIVLD